jgi:hypothetical protein
VNCTLLDGFVYKLVESFFGMGNILWVTGSCMVNFILCTSLHMYSYIFGQIRSKLGENIDNVSSPLQAWTSYIMK